jgi:hypothetical protein
MTEPVARVAQVDEALDALSAPSSSDVWRALHGHAPEDVAAVAARRALDAEVGFYPGLVSPIAPQAFDRSSPLNVSGYAFGARVVIPRSGTLRDLAIYLVGVSAGNISAGVYSAEDPRARLYTTGSIACPPAGSWQIVGDPQLPVVAGEQYDLAFSASDGTIDPISHAANENAVVLLPASYAGGVEALPKLGWYKSAAHPLPTTLAESAITVGATTFALIARVE